MRTEEEQITILKDKIKIQKNLKIVLHSFIMQNSEISKINKVAWEKTSIIHRKLKMDELLEGFKKPDYSLLDNVETGFLVDQININGKDVIQLCCNNARELLSIKNLGANRCVGVDISENFIKQGKELAEVAEQKIELYSMDVFEIPDTFYNSFDLVYLSVGVLCWLQDLNLLMYIISKLLRPNGYLFLYDLHPILNIYNPGYDFSMLPDCSYFNSEPFIDEASYDYLDKTAIVEAKTYSFQHTLEEIFMSCITNGLSIQEFREYNHDISNVFIQFKEYGFPMSYILLSQKNQE